jgi:AraC family transcriptional regulator
MRSRSPRSASRFVPVTMGSPRFRTVEVDGFAVTEAWFPPRLHLPPHVHRRAVFAVMLEGSFETVFAHQSHDCLPSTVWTEPAEERHGNRIEDAGAHVLVIEPDSRRDELLRPLRGLLDEVNNFRHGKITEIGWRIARELRSSDSVSGIAIEALTLDMLAIAGRLGDEGRGSSRPPEWLLETQEMIHGRFREALRVADLAGAVGVHPAHLARAFRSHFRMPIGAYIRARRLDWAAQRLVESSDPLSAIALESGFSDQSHFTRAFKRQVGVTPGRYRASRRRDSE